MISVLVPSYKQGRFLPTALRSLLAQSLGQWEAIVVVSSEEDARAASGFTHDARIRILERAPHGVADARNAAATIARFRWLLPLDADDAFEPNALAELWAVAPGGRYAVAYGDVALRGAKRGEWRPVFDAARMREANCLPYASLHTREVWNACGGWDVAMVGYEDWAYWVTATRCPLEVAHVPKFMLLHHRWQGSRSVSLDPWDATWRAMIHERHPDLYPHADREADRQTIADAYGLLPSLKKQLEFFPDNAALRDWVARIERG